MRSIDAHCDSSPDGCGLHIACGAALFNLRLAVAVLAFFAEHVRNTPPARR